MKKKHVAAALAAMALCSHAWSATFVNGSFEDGTLNGWTGGGGTWRSNPAPPVDPSAYAGGPTNNTIVSRGLDPITGANQVYGGDYAVRVNDSRNDYSVSTLTQSVTNYTENSIFFAWNAVLEASHGLVDSDYFSLTLVDDTTGAILVSRAYSSAGAIGDGTSGVTWTQYGNWYSSGWVVEQIDLEELGVVGHDFTLTLLASDCPYGGHAGYAYLDSFGAVAPTSNVPVPGALALLGIGALGLRFARRKP